MADKVLKPEKSGTEQKKPPSLSKFKNDIFTFEPLTIYTFSFLSFKDSIALIQSQRKLNLLKTPIHNGQLHLVWYALLETHWAAFIENNALYRFKKVYGWSSETVKAIVAMLRTKNAQYMQDEKSLGSLPRYFIPEQLLEGEEELIYLYSLISIYNDKYHIRHIDLQGPAVSTLAPNLPLYQIVLPSQQNQSFIVRTQEEETLVQDRNWIAGQIFKYMQEANRINNMHAELFCDLTIERDRFQQMNVTIAWPSIFSGIVRSRKADDKRLSNKFSIVPKKFQVQEDEWLFLLILQTSFPRL